MSDNITAIAGATGHLGGLVAKALRDRGARVRAIVRPGASPGKLASLRALGVHISEADYGDATRLTGRTRPSRSPVVEPEGLAGIDADCRGRPARDGVLARSDRAGDADCMRPACAVHQEGSAVPTIVVSDDEVRAAIGRVGAVAAQFAVGTANERSRHKAEQNPTHTLP